MSKIMQNLVVLMEPSKDAHNNSLEGGNMVLNRFCIDAFELSGVNYLKKSSEEMDGWKGNRSKFKQIRSEKGKEYSFL